MNPTPQATHARRLLLALTCTMAFAPSVWSQVKDKDPATAKPTAEKPAPAKSVVTSTTTSSSGKDEDTVVLSPFVVSTEKDSGYFAANTLAGSRLNTNIGDLAASITVVTKQQLEDTGSVDINDVFRYEANTEGASSYTPSTVSRGNFRDSIGGWSNDVDGGANGIATANRVRGLGAADTALNNYPTIARSIFDGYNTNSIEISRGPNSMLFGTGGASGIVNQSTAQAIIGKNKTSVELKGGSFGAYRASFNSNVAIGSKLAVYVAGLYDAKGFERKPSADLYRRQYVALNFSPTSKTHLTGSFENFDNYNNRPNYTMPDDLVTEWIAAGKPGWDPTTQMITYANGTTKGPYLLDTHDTRYVSAAVTPLGSGQINTTTSPLYVPSLQFPGRPTVLSWDNGNLVNYWVDNNLSGAGATTLPLSVFAAPAAAARTQAQWVIAGARVTSTQPRIAPIPDPSTGANLYGQWSEVGLSDKSIYDYTKYNIAGSNYGTQNNKTYNIEFQQEIFRNLNFNIGWFRQEFKERFTYGLGQANDSTRLYVDTNLKLLNGQPNPYFGSLFLRDYQTDSFSYPEINNNLRAMLAYDLDLTKNSGWSKILGRHRFLGLASQRKQWSDDLRYRMSNDGGDPRFLPTSATLTAAGNSRGSWAVNAANIADYYYVSKGVTQVTEGNKNPFNGFDGVHTATLNFYDWTTNSFSTSQMNFDPNLFYAGGGFGVTTRKTDSYSFSWQSWLWDDRIMPTIGWRHDHVNIRANDRSTLTNANLYTNGFGVLGGDAVLGTPVVFTGTTKTYGTVVRPFTGWDSISQKVANGSVGYDLLQRLSFHYNKSDNFNPPTTIQTDFFGNRLPTPSGHGLDYGFAISMFNNKLELRFNWYKATNEHAVSAAGSTPAGRMARIDTTSGRDWAREVVRIRHGENPTATDFDNNTVHPLTQQMQDEISALQGLPFTWPDGRNIQVTESNLSRGNELQLTYNPTRSWTMKLTGGKQYSSYSNAEGELKAWINYRLPQLMALAAPDMAPQYIRSNGNVLQLQNYWNGTGFSSDAVSGPTGPSSSSSTNTPNATYNSIVVPSYYQLIGLQNTNAANLREYTFSYLTNYNFMEGRLKGFGLGGNLRWSSHAVAGYYGLLDPTTYSHPSATQTAIVFPDLKRPIYTPSEAYVDLWLSYTRKIMNDKVRLKVQFNIRDANKSGGLQAVQFNPDGSPSAFRILDPRQYSLTTTFEF